MANPRWTTDWTVKVRVWVERGGVAVLGDGRAELLAAIGREQSITRAAKAAGMSYRRAWSLVQEMNEAAGEVLVEAAVGGKQGGGARLTAAGQMALATYEQVRQSLVESAAAALQRAVHAENRAADTLHLAAAISLQEAVGQILAEFALRRPTLHVRTIFGASNELADHLLSGAAGDVFVSAEARELDRLAAAGLIVANSRCEMARNGLAAIGRAGLKSIRKLTDFQSDQVKRIALAEPESPLGRYSLAYLQAAKAFDRLSSKVLWVDNSRAVLSAIVSQAAEVGLAFSSDAVRTGDWQLLFRVPTAKVAATYEAAMIGTTARPAESQALLNFLTTPTAQRCFRRCGLKPAART